MDFKKEAHKALQNGDYLIQEISLNRGRMADFLSDAKYNPNSKTDIEALDSKSFGCECCFMQAAILSHVYPDTIPEEIEGKFAKLFEITHTEPLDMKAMPKAIEDLRKAVEKDSPEAGQKAYRDWPSKIFDTLDKIGAEPMREVFESPDMQEEIVSKREENRPKSPYSPQYENQPQPRGKEVDKGSFFDMLGALLGALFGNKPKDRRNYEQESEVESEKNSRYWQEREENSHRQNTPSVSAGGRE